MGPGSREGPKVTLSVLFSSFANQELVLKQLAELKRAISELQNALLILYKPIQLWGGFSHAFGGPEARIGPPLRSKMGSVSLIFLLFFIVIFVLFVILGPIPKK